MSIIRDDCANRFRALSIAFIGTGKMSSAIALGLSRVSAFSAYHFVDRNQYKLEEIAKKIQPCTTSLDPLTATAHDIIVLGIRPTGIRDMATLLWPHLDVQRNLMISIAAGVTVQHLKSWFPPEARVVRTMPNMCLLQGQGGTSIVTDDTLPEDLKIARYIFGCCGECYDISESQMEAATALAGAGPAFVAMFAEAMADGAVANGLSRGMAQRMTADLFVSSGKLLQDTHPAVIKDMVCSPGGCSIRGVCALEASQCRHAVIESQLAVAQKAADLSK